MKQVRVLVANRPRLMRQLLLAAIADQPDIEIVGEAEDEAGILEAVEQNRPNFLIVALEESDERPVICDLLLQKYPGLKVLAIAPDRNSSIFCWAALDVHSARVETSEDGILRALRSNVEPVGGNP